jgi:hypothetical protein
MKIRQCLTMQIHTDFVKGASLLTDPNQVEELFLW